MKKHFDLHADYQPENFEFDKKFMKLVKEAIARYPQGRQQSAVMPLLDLVQRQVAEEGAKAKPLYGGWIPRSAMDHIADILDMHKVKVYEVASFYSMYNTAPVGKYLIQFCTTTPCWLCGSDKIVDATKDYLGIGMGETTKNGRFSLMEVECLGACVNAPMAQIGDDFFEDLDDKNIIEVLKKLAAGQKPKCGSQTGRTSSEPAGGSTTLKIGSLL